MERFARRARERLSARRFRRGVRRGEPVKTTPDDAVENMSVIDAIYRAAGLPLREPSLNRSDIRRVRPPKRRDISCLGSGQC